MTARRDGAGEFPLRCNPEPSTAQRLTVTAGKSPPLKRYLERVRRAGQFELDVFLE